MRGFTELFDYQLHGVFGVPAIDGMSEQDVDSGGATILLLYS